MEWSLSIIFGSLVGFLVSVTGIGGGSLMTPLLLFGLGLPPLSAIGTDIVFALITKTLAFKEYARMKKGIHSFPLRKLIPPVLLGSILGILVLLQIRDHLHIVEITLSSALGLALVAVAFTIAAKNSLQRSKGNVQMRPCVAFALTTLVSATIPLTSIGSGALFVPLLIFVYRIPTKNVVPTSLLVGIMALFLASVTHSLGGAVRWDLLPFLVLGAIPGIWIGTRASLFMSPILLERILAITLFLSGIKVMIR